MSWPEFLNIQMSLCPFVPLSSLMLFVYTNFVTVVLALFSNVSVTSISGVQIFPYDMHAVFNPFRPFTSIRFAFSGKAPLSHLIQITLNK